ncbi:hypothetical protein CVT24_001638 [Panaeolus cyanescens]|uniref:U3 small nucleolar RNA-associated protein 22 n=1 Tax=Panaeolus cyanescens TaxID=181874 RepID=A0A409VSV3_9AGAR|nr:hypothetical protein CVT24_001638 [Panaeolus cyanescens]
MSGLKRKRAQPTTSNKAQRMEEDDPMQEQSEAEMSGQDEGSMSEGEGGDDEHNEAEDNWEGIEGGVAMDVDNAADGARGTKKTPTGQELRVIKDATDLFKSSSFKLQIDALLPNVRPKASRIASLERFLFTLHGFLKEISHVNPSHPLEAARKLLKKGVAVPYSLPLPTEDTNWKVSFAPPTEIALVGSWANKVSVKAKDGHPFGVDLAVEMPNDLFQEKDYLNGRFFHKRAFYLATIAAAIKNPKSKLNVDVSYDSLSGDPRLTKLVLTPNDSKLASIMFLNRRLIEFLSANSPIPLHRLSPHHSNIRINTNENAECSTTSHSPTPHYNNALLRTLSPRSYLLAVHALQVECDAFSDALTLLRIWSNQRGYGEGDRACVHGFDGAGSFWWSLLALLLNGEELKPGVPKSKQRRSVGKGLSSYQLFKAALEFLAKHDFSKEKVFVKSPEGQRYSVEEYQIPTFVDSASLVNLVDIIPLNSLQLLKYDAAKSLETLNQLDFSGDPFQTVFMKDNRDLLTRFDIVLKVDLSSAKPRKSSAHATLDAGAPANQLLASMNSVILRGLGDRSRAVALLYPSVSGRPLSQAHPSSPETVFVGIIHDPTNAFRLVDHGPAAEDTDEVAREEFRDFWGNKAELRRFKDGRIVESVVWEVSTADERMHVPSMIIRHLLKRHFNIGDDAVETWQTSFDSVLRLPTSISKDIIASGVPTGFKAAMTAFDNVVREIKKLDDKLPLGLLNVSPISDSLRYTSVFSPVPLPSSLAPLLPPNARYTPHMEMIIEFEKSSRWPDDLKAIQAIKLAFLEHVGSSLMQAVEGLRANVVTGDGVHDSAIMDQAYLEVITPQGWSFAARIWHDREIHLLDQIIGGRAATMPHIVSKTKEKKSPLYNEAVEAKEVHIRRYIHAPRHHRAIAALSHHYPAFGGTVRLVKRWLASHWILQSHISDEVIEIICASFFLGGGHKITQETDIEQTSKHLVPASKERGFAAVVQFLSDWKWEEGLFVPLYGGAALDESAKHTVPKLVPASVWKVSTEFDKEGHMWTHSGPDFVVANRVRALATATWQFMQGIERGQLNVKSLFIHPTDDYDFLIKLDPSILPRYHHNVNADLELLTKRGKYANLAHEAQVTVMPGFDPARLFFNDLQRIYADTFKIFYDPLGGDTFGAVWDPSLKEPRPFRVLGGFSSMPVKKENDKAKDKGLVALNQTAIIAEIERLGKGIIKKIIIQRT